MRGDRALPINAIRTEAAWMRRLALALTREGATADDAVQETWATLLARPPRDGSLAGWLSVVLRNVVRKAGRSEIRRRAREQAACEDEVALDPQTLAERFEARHLLADLVLELEEPYRSTVLLCYYEGLSPAEISRQQGLPPGTVRWRLKQGLDRLRTQLARQYDGPDRLRALLLPTVRGRRRWTALWKGLMAVKTTTKAGALAMLVIATALVGRRILDRSPASPTGTVSGTVAAPAAQGATREPSGTSRPALGTFRSGARTPLPRFTVAATREDAGAAALRATPGKLSAAGNGPRSRFDTPPPNFQAMQKLVRERLQSFHEKADQCLAGWSAPDPALQKGVMLGIDLDREGLQSVWLKDLVDVPDGPLRCLSDAVYQVDWSGITEQPVTLTVPQRYDDADAGAK